MTSPDSTTLQRALVTIKKLKHLLEEKKSRAEPIAIIGLSCRFPEANGKDEYWQLLINGKNTIKKFPDDRWDYLKNTQEATVREASHPYWGSYLQNIADFDAYFFGISPREALRMDPQQRLLLEVTYEALEDAGIPAESLAGSNTGIFTSLYPSQLAQFQALETDLDALYLPTGNATSIAANRLSYLLDLHGPSIVLDTACSSSLVAIHLACLHLQTKLCDTALVCGANLNLLPSINSVLAKASMLSPDGQCKTFDAKANGYVQGEGVGVIVLKPLSKAKRDNDRIYAVINSSGVNQDGKTNGLTAPNGLQQQKLIHTVYKQANLNANDVSYIECHGTGTLLGDPIEMQALGEVVSTHRAAETPCWIGSVKSNIGHLEPAAGMASIIKVALALEQAKIPPHLNFAEPNPHINFKKYHFRVPTKLEAWPKYGFARLAGISGFGFGGTNAHIVLRDLTDEEKEIKVSDASSQLELFVLSTKDAASMQQLIARWHTYLTSHPAINFAQICYQTHLRRTHHSYRVAIVAASINELCQKLSLLQDNLSSQDTSIYTNTQHGKVENELEKLALSYVKQEPIDWKQYEATRSFTFIDMPLYPWQHKTYWPPLKNHIVNNAIAISPKNRFQGKKITSPLSTGQFEFVFNTQSIPEIKDTHHILHAGYYVEMIAFVVNYLFKRDSFSVTELIFSSPLIVPQDATTTVQLIIQPENDSTFSLIFYSYLPHSKDWKEHAKCQLELALGAESTEYKLTEIKKRCPQTGDAADFYARVAAMNMPGEGSIRWTNHFWHNEQEILCEFQQPSSIDKAYEYYLKTHFSVIDACIQGGFKVLPTQLIKPFVASKIGRMQFHGTTANSLYLFSSLNEILANGEQYRGDWSLLNENGQPIIECHDLWMTQLGNKVQIETIAKTNSAPSLNLHQFPQHERKARAIDYLSKQAAAIFSMPESDVDVNLSLRDMGLDSLTALVFMRMIESELGITYSLQDLLQGPTITEIAQLVAPAEIHASKPSPKTNQWIAFRKPRNHPKMRLFCFPYGGGGASIYSDWHTLLPDAIDVCPVQLPGRENRMDEPTIQHIDHLVEELMTHLKSEFDLPFAFFGHSFGSLVSFELARYMRRHGLPQPMHIFASAYPDPRHPSTSLDNLLGQLKAKKINLLDLKNEEALLQLSNHDLNNISEVFQQNGITEYSGHIMDKEIIKLLMPIFTADMSIVKSYSYYSEPPLNIPITVFSGKKDTWVLPLDHQGWVDHSTLSTQFHEFDEGHLFVRNKNIRSNIIQIVTNAMI